MKKLNTIIIVLAGLLLVACSPRVHQPPPIAEVPTDLSDSGIGANGSTGYGDGPSLTDGTNGTGINADTTWGGPSGEQSISRRPGTDWTKDSNLETIYFDYDKYDLTESARRTLLRNSEYLRSNPNSRILVEGNCDERGTEEYNQALGENRALAVREYLTQLGISPSRIDVISYGELRPVVEGSDESSRAQNRRADFKVAG
jgi:peptidoglycan-associated lipoprotein